MNKKRQIFYIKEIIFNAMGQISFKKRFFIKKNNITFFRFFGKTGL